MTNLNKVLVCGASPDNGNRNVVLRGYLAEGFRELLGEDNVHETPLEFSAGHIARVAPSFVVCFGSCMPDDADFGAIRRQCTLLNIPLVFWLHDDPYEFDFNYKIHGIADIVFSNDRWAAEHYNHPATYHLPLAASRNAHWKPLALDSKDLDVFFCGVAFPNRVKLIKDLSPILLRYRTAVLGDGWPDGLAFCENRRLSNDELSLAYNKASLTINMGRNFHYANDRYKLDPSTPGPRTFEAAMAGTTQAYFVESLEIIEYYQPSTEILLYNSPREFELLLEEMLDDRDRCLQIAKAAQNRTLSDHTYYHRAKEIHLRVTRLVGGGQARPL